MLLGGSNDRYHCEDVCSSIRNQTKTNMLLYISSHLYCGNFLRPAIHQWDSASMPRLLSVAYTIPIRTTRANAYFYHPVPSLA